MLFVSRLWPVTQRVIAIGFDKRVLGNTWWGFNDDALDEHQRAALILWMNSTLGILSYFGRRAVTRSAWMQMKKPAWASMPVLDVRALSKTDLVTLAQTYDRLAAKELAPIAHLDADPVRREIDETLCEVLGLPSLAPIRELLAREPGLTARDIAPQPSGPSPSAVCHSKLLGATGAHDSSSTEQLSLAAENLADYDPEPDSN
jgi:hypothetical protein